MRKIKLSINPKLLGKQSFEYLMFLMDQDRPKEEILDLIQTKSGYKGTRNMTHAELLLHHNALRIRCARIRAGRI